MKYEVIKLKDYFPFLGENGADPYVELYLPYNMTEMHHENRKRPCMVVCPGGGYGMCSQRESEPIALKFLQEGFNVFVITYSVAPHRFPAQLCQVAALMELIYKNADEWNCDTRKIAIIGFSAGGHLAAHYSTMFDCAEVRAVFPESKSVNASILCYPVISAESVTAHMGSFENLLGHKPQNQAETDYFSCDKNVKPTTPPAFLWHTAEDSCVPLKNSLLYAEALWRNNVPVELHVYPFGGHGLSTCDNQTIDEITPVCEYNSAWIPAAQKWLKLIFEL
jgi:acetyl esterase/lipase